MRLSKLFNIFSAKEKKKKKKRHHDKDVRSKVSRKKKDLSNLVVHEELFCPGCKKHCNLLSPKCAKGKEYAKRKTRLEDKEVKGELFVQNTNEDLRIFTDFINDYNECFYKKDIEKLKEFYDVENNSLIYLDNHKNNDTYNLEQHINLLADFFENGKKTESGGVEPLLIEKFNVFRKGDAACLCYIARYKSSPDSAVRCTLYLECLKEKWKIIHVHCSFQPDK